MCTNCTHTGLLVTLALSENIRLELHLFLQQVVEGLDLLGSARRESRVTSLLVACSQQLTSAATTSAASGHLRGMVLTAQCSCMVIQWNSSFCPLSSLSYY